MTRSLRLALLAGLLVPGCGTSRLAPPASPPLILGAQEIADRLDAGEGRIPLGAGDDYAASVVRLVEPLPGHLHRERTEVVIVLGGRGEIVLGGDRRPLEAGMVIFIPPGVYHAVTPGSGGADVAILRLPPTGPGDTIR